MKRPQPQLGVLRPLGGFVSWRLYRDSVERSCGLMNKNRIEGVADQGERARNREALVIKGKRRRSGGRAAAFSGSC
jgi:hypothetical protein